MAQARCLVAASVQAQALQAGVWQQHRGLQWWQSGLPAMAANLVVGCAPDVPDLHCQALARLMQRCGGPVGWLVWPDQAPERQEQLLKASGFRCCERIWLASVAGAELVVGEAAGSCRQLGPGDRAALIVLLQACHGLHPAVADVISAAFLERRAIAVSQQLQATVQLRTFAMGAEDPVVPGIQASITAVLWRAPAQTCGALIWLGTHPHWRRRGYGTQVTAAACRWLRACGAQHLYVQASCAAVPIYRGMGFTEDGWLQLWGCAA